MHFIYSNFKAGRALLADEFCHITDIINNPFNGTVDQYLLLPSVTGNVLCIIQKETIQAPTRYFMKCRLQRFFELHKVSLAELRHDQADESLQLGVMGWKLNYITIVLVYSLYSIHLKRGFICYKAIKLYIFTPRGPASLVPVNPMMTKCLISVTFTDQKSRLRHAD